MINKKKYIWWGYSFKNVLKFLLRISFEREEKIIYMSKWEIFNISVRKWWMFKCFNLIYWWMY